MPSHPFIAPERWAVQRIVTRGVLGHHRRMMGPRGGSETYAALLERVADDLRCRGVKRWDGDKPPEEPESAIALRDAICDDLVELLLLREGVEDPLDLIRADLADATGIDATGVIEHWHDDDELAVAVEQFLDSRAEDHLAPPDYRVPSANQLRRALLQATILPWLGGDALTALDHSGFDRPAALGVADGQGPEHEVPDDRRGRGWVHLCAHAIGRARH